MLTVILGRAISGLGGAGTMAMGVIIITGGMDNVIANFDHGC